MQNINENNKYTVITDNKIDYRVRPSWTMSPSFLSRWATDDEAVYEGSPHY